VTDSRLVPDEPRSLFSDRYHDAARQSAIYSAGSKSPISGGSSRRSDVCRAISWFLANHHRDRGHERGTVDQQPADNAPITCDRAHYRAALCKFMWNMNSAECASSRALERAARCRFPMAIFTLGSPNGEHTHSRRFQAGQSARVRRCRYACAVRQRAPSWWIEGTFARAFKTGPHRIGGAHLGKGSRSWFAYRAKLASISGPLPCYTMCAL